MKKGWVKGICAVLCAVLLTGGVCSGMLLIWQSDFSTFYGSPLTRNQMIHDRWLVTEYWDRIQSQQEGAVPDQYGQNWLTEHKYLLNADTTNFRFRVTDPAGNVVFTNVPEGQMLEETVYWKLVDEFVTDVQGFHGYETEDGVQYITYTIDYGVASPLTVQDTYWNIMLLYQMGRHFLPYAEALLPVCLAIWLVLLVLLMCFAGRRAGRDGVVLNLLDRVPYDLVCLVACGLFSVSVVTGEYTMHAINMEDYIGLPVAFLCLSLLFCSAVLVAFLLTTATRIKAHTLWRNTVLWRLGGVVARTAGQAMETLPLTWRAAGLFLTYLLGTVLTGLTMVLIPFYQGLVLFLICRWVLQWRSIREITGAIVTGHTDVKIDSAKFYPDLRQHANQLNDLGTAIDCAVEERLKSERFKAELITNVSHDLKTPLTSIINYVDLLKKEDIANPKAQEYLEVLERKSLRLKKLTEDLVEASKASTGTLTVNLERLDVVQLVEQAVGEYEERLHAAGLVLVKALPEEPVWIDADGRRLWRVLDNLLGNCAKYAQEGTRVYLDVCVRDGSAVLTVKNVSRQPLNIPAEQLMERFVRGDESRATEGSGLGLSIARSLTELQGGMFSLDIDGDLFKALVVFPLVRPFS